MSKKSSDYSELSKLLTAEINKTDKQKYGIYFTPPETIIKNIEFLKPFMKDIKTILEPSCGSCEYIIALKEINKDSNITGVELNKTIFKSIKHIEEDNITLFNDNYLTHDFNSKFDLIIGNSPYFVMKKKEVDLKYHDYFEGRPNIFILFIIKSLDLLNDNGIMSFVLPKNFLNCLYYDKTRKYIVENYNILTIIDCSADKYMDTQQDTIILIIKKDKPKDHNISYHKVVSEYTIFGTPDNINELKELYKDSQTLFELGYKVNVGNVVWNQCKNILTDDSAKTLLVYSSDIANNTISIKNYSNPEKKNYIDREGTTDPLLVINRGYGVGKYTFNYCIINENSKTEYLIENHLICIKDTNKVSDKELITNYRKIIESFENKKTIEFIKIYFGNNAMNTTELCKILPIYFI